jgi:cyclophilin family peptidyl-prolyl cis-trans isomerase
MYIFQKIKVVMTAERIFTNLLTSDNVSSLQELAKKSFYSSVAFHKVADQFNRTESLTDASANGSIPSADIRRP